MKILITGGAGYIGSVANAFLNALGFETIVLDNLIYGHKEATEYSVIKNPTEFLKEANLLNNATALNIQNPQKNTLFIKADLANKTALKNIFAEYKIAAVLHFAAFAYVGESVENPAKYYANNVANTLNLLDVMREFRVFNIIFSSTCATYGVPQKLPLEENHPQNPINPYGKTKWMMEQILADYAAAYGFKFVILRYFNAAGASHFFDIGESHKPETHLLPLVLEAALKKRAVFRVFGDDYATPDGSCIRDFIHVDDLAAAHILALRFLNDSKNNSAVFNLGNGKGFSVKEVIKAAEKIVGEKIPCEISDRRAGDPAILVGSSKKAKQVLAWNPQFSNIEDILKSALNWHKNQRY